MDNLNKPKVENLIQNNSQISKAFGECDATCDFPDLNDVNVTSNSVLIPDLTSINDAFDSLISDINQSLDILAANDLRLYNDLDGIHTFLENLTDGLSRTFGYFCNFELTTLGELCLSPYPK